MWNNTLFWCMFPLSNTYYSETVVNQQKQTPPLNSAWKILSESSILVLVNCNKFQFVGLCYVSLAAKNLCMGTSDTSDLWQGAIGFWTYNSLQLKTDGLWLQTWTVFHAHQSGACSKGLERTLIKSDKMMLFHGCKPVWNMLSRKSLLCVVALSRNE